MTEDILKYGFVVAIVLLLSAGVVWTAGADPRAPAVEVHEPSFDMTSGECVVTMALRPSALYGRDVIIVELGDRAWAFREDSAFSQPARRGERLAVYALDLDDRPAGPIVHARGYLTDSCGIGERAP